MSGDNLSFPDGLSERQVSGAGFSPLSWAPLAIFGAVLALALSGLFGGHAPSRHFAEGRDGRLEVSMPATLRNGQIFEMEIRIVPARPLAATVFAVDASYWRNLTVNTVRPEAASQDFRGDAVLLDFGPLAAGETLTIALEGQVNPVLGQVSRGMARLQDGDTVLAEIPLELKVWP
jgi:hypothetical protein